MCSYRGRNTETASSRGCDMPFICPFILLCQGITEAACHPLTCLAFGGGLGDWGIGGGGLLPQTEDEGYLGMPVQMVRLRPISAIDTVISASRSPNVEGGQQTSPRVYGI